MAPPIDADDISLEAGDQQADDRASGRVGDDLWNGVLPRRAAAAAAAAARRLGGRGRVQLAQGGLVVHCQRHLARL